MLTRTARKASLVGGANDRFAAVAAPAPARPVYVAGADSRFAAGVRAQEPMRRLKRELRSRIRAKDHRKGVAVEDAHRRLNAPPEDPRLTLTRTWQIDDGVNELCYPEGSWVCRRCSTVNPPFVRRVPRLVRRSEVRRYVLG